MLKFTKLSGPGVAASGFMLIASLLLWAGNVFAQSTEKEVAVVELGGAAERSLTEGIIEPSYDYKFGPGHEHSLGVSGGLLIAIP